MTSMYEHYLASWRMQQALSSSLPRVYGRAAKSFKKRDLKFYEIMLLYAIGAWAVINPQAYLTPRQIFYLISVPSQFQTSIRRELRSLVSQGILETGIVIPTKLKRGRPCKGSLKLLEASKVYRHSKGYRSSMPKEPARDDLEPLADSGILMANILPHIHMGAKAIRSEKLGALLGWIFKELKEIFLRALDLNLVLSPENILNPNIQSLVAAFPQVTEYLPISRQRTKKLDKLIRALPSKASPDKQLELMKEGYSTSNLYIGLRGEVLCCSKCYDKSKDLFHYPFSCGTELDVMFILSSPTEFDEELHKMREKYDFANAYTTHLAKCVRKKLGEPYRYEILNCLPFLRREIEICQPRMTVIVGKQNYNVYGALVKSCAAEIPVTFVFSNKDGDYIKEQDKRFQEIKELYERIRN